MPNTMIRDGRKKAIKIKYVNEIAPHTYAAVGDQVAKNCAQMRIVGQAPVSNDPEAIGITVERFGYNSAIIFIPQEGAVPWMYIFTSDSKIESVDAIVKAINSGVSWFKDILMVAYRVAKARNKEEILYYKNKLNRIGIDSETGKVPRPGYKGKGMCSVCLSNSKNSPDTKEKILDGYCNRYNRECRHVARNCKGNI